MTQSSIRTEKRLVYEAINIIFGVSTFLSRLNIITRIENNNIENIEK